MVNNEDNVKKTRRRRGMRAPDIRRYYFGPEEQRAIELFQGSSDINERTRLYIDSILPAFDKLVENLICIYKFTGLYDSHEDLKNDCITFLYETLNKFDTARGTKAFSYFNVVAKNWLIVRSKKRQVSLKRMISLDSVDITGKTGSSIAHSKGGKNAMQVELDEQFIVDGHDEDIIASERIDQLMKVFAIIRDRLTNENELKCIDSVITLFEKRDSLPLLNKRAVFTYIREMSDLTPKQLTMAISVIKKHFNSLKPDADLGIL